MKRRYLERVVHIADGRSIEKSISLALRYSRLRISLIGTLHTGLMKMRMEPYRWRFEWT